MRLEAPCVRLFDYAVQGLRDVTPPPEAAIWDQNRARQQAFKVHRDTRSILFEWLDNSWQIGMPVTVERHSYAPTELASEVYGCANMLAKYFDGTIAKLMLAELAPRGQISGHTDQAPALRAVHRCHVPVITNENVVFDLDHRPHYLASGRVYELDNTRYHAVVNNSDDRRVHLICDILPKSSA